MNNGQRSRAGGGANWSFWSHVISLTNLLQAWREFKRGKIKKPDVLEFDFALESNLIKLHQDLAEGNYRPGLYQAFFVRDPKLRRIHKASVRDRVVHQALFRVLYHFFDRHFIYDSYSCRFNKGTHKGVDRLTVFTRKVSANWRLPAYALQCDILKFFDHVDHARLVFLIEKVIKDEKVLRLVRLIVQSFQTSSGKGLPLGNVTSQLFANIYLNELDQFVKLKLKVTSYLRYCDDFVLVGRNQKYLLNLIKSVDEFLHQNLGLNLHPKKIQLRKIRQGIDCLGYVVLPHYRTLRTRTRRRLGRRLRNGEIDSTNLSSYLGMLKHCHGRRLEEVLKFDTV